MTSDRDNRLIGPIAAFIGARLQYPNPAVNGQGNPWVSTIRVEQHKEKFWYVRVYCKLAAPELVAKKWQWLKENQELRSQVPVRYVAPVDVTGDEPTPEFYQRCLKRDAMYYREVYMDMVALQPHLKGKICAQADYTELLYDTYEEVEKRIDEMTVTSDSYLQHACQRYGCNDVVKLKSFMKLVYEPSMRDRIDLSG